MRIVLTVLALLIATPVSAAAEQAAMPGWIAGAWAQEDGEAWADEFWTPPRGGLMIGAARIGRGERIEVFEHTRIVALPDGKLMFYAQPFGAPPANFPMVERGPLMIEFANAAHDYPQRIRYWREGSVLRARISLMDGSRAAEWTYRMMGTSE